MDVTVYPEQGEFPRIARALLDAADNPQQVRVVSHPQMGFLVPEEVFDRFQTAEQSGWEKADEVTEPEAALEPVPSLEPMVPRRRGRPRKNPLPEQKVEGQ